ncbi:MAG: TonB-dependent receptor, partial [Steroidobacteraceae bacterium]|nr:TonB-dependent receptor [Steroidobacteraceae bacterium]MDW8259033.1 TonB-dependent receptor [Gammaproteobacteria bacterium]
IPARIDFNGLQISTTTNPADLRNNGLEIDAEWQATDNFSLTIGAGFQRAKYVDISERVLAQAAVCRANPAGLYQGAPACNANFVDQFGNIATPVRAPDYTLSLSGTYRKNFGNVTLIPTFGANISDAYAIGTTGSPQSTVGTWSKRQTYLNAGIGVEFANVPGLTLQIDCRNCADKNYPMSALGPFQFLDRPGSYSLRVRYRFDAGD